MWIRWRSSCGPISHRCSPSTTGRGCSHSWGRCPTSTSRRRPGKAPARTSPAGWPRSPRTSTSRYNWCGGATGSGARAWPLAPADPLRAAGRRGFGLPALVPQRHPAPPVIRDQMGWPPADDGPSVAAEASTAGDLPRTQVMQRWQQIIDRHATLMHRVAVAERAGRPKRSPVSTSWSVGTRGRGCHCGCGNPSEGIAASRTSCKDCPRTGSSDSTLTRPCWNGPWPMSPRSRPRSPRIRRRPWFRSTPPISAATASSRSTAYR